MRQRGHNDAPGADASERLDPTAQQRIRDGQRHQEPVANSSTQDDPDQAFFPNVLT